jgi:hypothetical protein
MAESSSGTALEEWKETRGILSRFDGNLHDLRKYGFTFLAALFTIDALQKLVSNNITDYVRLGLIGITIAFIITLRFLDHNYQQFQNAASIRARILERMLNIEVTETISERYKKEKIYNWNLGVYIGFVIIALLIGFIILPLGIYWLGPFVFACIGIGFLLFIKYSKDLNVNLHHHGTELKEDWIIDKVSCKQGEKVRITITNLDEKNELIILSGKPVCDIRDEENTVSYPQLSENGISIPPDGNYSWLWDTGNVTPDTIYRIFPRGWGGEPMRRSIVVYGPAAEINKDTTPVSVTVINE